MGNVIATGMTPKIGFWHTTIEDIPIAAPFFIH